MGQRAGVLSPNRVELWIDAAVVPTIKNLEQRFGGFGILALVVRLKNPAVQDLARA